MCFADVEGLFAASFVTQKLANFRFYGKKIRTDFPNSYLELLGHPLIANVYHC